jgi:hypothetical protein
VLHPEADAYVHRSEREKNFGKNEILRLDGQPAMIAYLRFDLPRLNDGQVINKAILRLYARDGSERGVTVWIADGKDWEEGRLTYNNAPKVGERSVRSGRIRAGEWVEIDVTSLVRGKSQVTLVLTAAGEAQVNFSSREAGSLAPQLVITTQRREDDDRDKLDKITEIGGRHLAFSRVQ